MPKDCQVNGKRVEHVGVIPVARHHLNEVENGTGKKQQPQDETVKDEFQVKVEDGQARKRQNEP